MTRTPATPASFTVESHPNPVSDERVKEILAKPGFGAHFTDHMVVIDWDEENGWHDARVQPYQPFELDPATSVLHYGQAIFEGIKAYRQPDGTIATFRPDRNAKRMQDSAQRMAMPKLPEELFIESLRQIVRPTPAGCQPPVGKRPLPAPIHDLPRTHSRGEAFILLHLRCYCLSRGAYFAGGIKPVTVWLSTEYVRAAPGGTGAAKFAGNYAASLVAQAQAETEGCDQVVWLDAHEHKWVEEMGGMNLAFVYGEGESPDHHP